MPRRLPNRSQSYALPKGHTPLGSLTASAVIRSAQGTGTVGHRVFGQWAFVYVLAGEGHYDDENGIEVGLHPGSWILVFPEIAHRYNPLPRQTWTQFYLAFEGVAFEQWRQSDLVSPVRPTGAITPVATEWQSIERLLRALRELRTSPLEAIMLWQTYLARVVSRQVPLRPNQEWIERACRILDRRHEADHSVDLREVARQLGLGYETFRKAFTQRLGVPPSRYGEHRRIDRAKQLLLSRRISNKELADLLGYYDEAHFSRAFKRVTGASPRHFKQKLVASPRTALEPAHLDRDKSSSHPGPGEIITRS